MMGDTGKFTWLFLATTFLLLSCGNNGFFQTEQLTEFAVARISIGTDSPSIRSDSSNTATITASVLDVNNGAVEGVTVVFSTDSGQLNKSSAVTDANGQAAVTLTAGNADKSNRTLMVSATAEGQSAQIPIDVVGTSIDAQGQASSLTTSGSTVDTVVITVKDAGDNPINEATVTSSVSGTGSVTVTLGSSTTNTSGQATATVTGTQSGTATVTFSSMGVSSSITYTIAADTDSFRITAPAKSPITAAEVGNNVTVTVQAPTQANVTFVSTIGTWNGGANQTVTVAASGQLASATLSSSVAGTATVQVFDAASPTVTDTVEVAFSIPVSAASKVILKSNITAVAPSIGDSKNIAILTAKVTSADDQPVQGAVVYFTLERQTSSGEKLSPVSAVTDVSGEATTTFTSGSLPTGQDTGVIIKASVLNTALTDTEIITVGGTPGSVTIGRATVINIVHNETSYELPMAVLVTDVNGAAIQNATVTLKVWPAYFSYGFWDYIPGVKECAPIHTGEYANEDVNENLIMDAGEDVARTSESYWDRSLDILSATLQYSNAYATNGVLDPPNTAGGAIDKATVVTSENGVADFNLVYTKNVAMFVKTRIRATVQAQGTETINEYSFWLPAAGTDVTSVDACFMPDPPFGP